MSKTIVVCATIAFAIVMCAFVVLSLKHVDTAPLVTFAIGLASGVAPGLASYFKSHEAQKNVAEVAADVQIVKDQTNGPLTKAISNIDDLKSLFKGIQASDLTRIVDMAKQAQFEQVQERKQ